MNMTFEICFIFHYIISQNFIVVLFCTVSVVRPWLLSFLLRIFLSFLSSHFSHCILYQHSPTPSLSFAVVLHSPPTLSRSLFTQSSHHILDLPLLIFASTFFICSFWQFFISYSFHISDPFQPHQFLLKTFLHSNLHSQFIHSSFGFSLHSHNLLIELFSQTCTFSCCFSVSGIVSKPYM